MPVSQRMLSRMLFERRLLVQAERDRDRYTVRRDLEGRRRNVLHLRRDILDAPSSERTAQPSQDDTDDSAPIWRDTETGPLSWTVTGDDDGVTAQDNGPQAQPHNEGTATGGPSGPFGPFAGAHDTGFAARLIGWRCTACRAIESLPQTDGRRCAGCGAVTDDTGRVTCASCDCPAEDGQRLRCLACVAQAGGAA